MIDSNKLVKNEKPLIFSDNNTQTTKTQSVSNRVWNIWNVDPTMM